MIITVAKKVGVCVCALSLVVVVVRRGQQHERFIKGLVNTSG